MGSRVNSSQPTVFSRSKRQRRIYGPNLHGLDVFGTAFADRGGCFRNDIKELWAALPDEHGEFQVTTTLPQEPEPLAPVQAPLHIVPNAVDAFYEEQFRRLERDLKPIVNPRRPAHVPPLVSEGRVPQMSLEVGAAGVSEPMLFSVLEEHVPANQPKGDGRRPGVPITFG